METYIKNYQYILDKTKVLQLPPDAWKFTADDNSMYTNIDTEHATYVISWWLDELAANSQLPNNFPLEAVKVAMTLIMKNNVF